MSVFTDDQVRKHNKTNNLWVVNKGKVYDISDFASRHPGGQAVLVQHAGEDVTALMSNGAHVHSAAAYRILDKYYIGESRQPKSQDKSNGACEDQQLQSKSVNGHSRGVTESVHNWKDDDLVDWNKPVLWQVGQLGENYMTWVHSPVDKHIRLFYSDFVEYFSMTPWYVVPIFWIPFVILFLMKSYGSFQNSGTELWLSSVCGGMVIRLWHMPILFVLGLFLWSFLEYILHRWLFHLPPPTNSPFLVTMHFLLHGQHHKAPFDEKRLVFPIVPAGIFTILFYFIFTSAFPMAMAYSLMAGSLTGYICYDLTHYYLHHGSPFLNYFKRLKRYHIRHHFDNQQKGFGISSKLWDYPFGTLIPEVSDKAD